MVILPVGKSLKSQRAQSGGEGHAVLCEPPCLLDNTQQHGSPYF